MAKLHAYNTANPTHRVFIQKEMNKELIFNAWFPDGVEVGDKIEHRIATSVVVLEILENRDCKGTFEHESQKVMTFYKLKVKPCYI